MKRLLATLTCVLSLVPARAYAGGFEIPDNGTEALGRGGAFTAKADDGTALEYNIAGLARQRGTRLLIDGNLVMNQYSFQRYGVFPDNSMDPHTPWGGAFFPQVSNQAGPFAAPFIALTSDLGFDRMTFALGVFGPPGVGKRTYPLGVLGAPSPARYDIVSMSNTIAYPTLAAAYRVTPELDLGVAFHAVYASFDQEVASFTDISPQLCPNPEYYRCDSLNEIRASTWSWAASLGGMWRPDSWLQIGANVRTPVTLSADGTVYATPPLAAPAMLPPSPMHLDTKLPLEARAGVRFIFMDGKFENGDLEVDGTYEKWSDAQGVGPVVTIPQLGLFKDIQTVSFHGYKDTYSLRVGGAYNWHGLGGVLTARAGAYYDSSATDPQFTRLDFDTLERYAGTIGLGWHIGGITFNAAYAEVFSPDRIVTNGVIAPANGAQHGQPVDAQGNVLPAVNNGQYSSHTRIVSVGLEIRWDVLLGDHTRRTSRYGADYEEVGPPLPPPRVEPHEREEAAPPPPPAPEKSDDDENTERPPARPAPKKSDWDD
jgi:long-subunit fatty acid transport protein